MEKTFLKNVLVLLLLFVGHNQVFAQRTREVYIGDEVMLVAPSPPQGAIFQTAWAGRHKALKVTKDGVYAAKVKVTEYFSGTAQVQCDYYWYYYVNGRQYTRHATTFFDFRCKQVSVMLDSTMTLDKGSGEYLYATFSPSNVAVKPTVTWNSSNPSVASVSYTGYVKALSPGETTITVTTNYKTSASCTVIVEDDTPEPPPPPTPPSGGDDDDDEGGSDDSGGGDDSGGDEDDSGPQYLEMFIDKAKKRIRGLKVKLLDYL